MLFREAQVHGERLEVLDEARHGRGIGALPLGAEAVHAPLRLTHGELARWGVDAVEDLPPVGPEGVLVGSGDLGECISQSVDDASLTERAGKDVLDRRDEPWRAVGDDEKRGAKTTRGEVLEEPGPGVGRLRCRRLEPDEANTRLLLMLVEDRRQLVDDKTRLALRLQDCLNQYFPQLVKWFDVDTPLVADLLKQWPDLQDLQHCHDGTLRRFFRKHHYGEELTAKRIEAIRAAVPATNDPAVLEAGAMKARHLTESIATLRDQIKRLERRRDELVASHPDAPIFASFPGAGPATVPRLIAAFGTRRERYQSAFEVQCDSGIAPVHVRSGKVDLVSMRRACQDFTRQTFHEFAGQSLARCEWANAYYHAHCTKPEQHHAAVRALAFKWIRIMYRCWKDHTPYDEQLYLTSQRRRKALLGPGLASVTSLEWTKVAGFSKLSEKKA